MTTTIPQWTLGDRLAKARKDAGLKQQELADRIGVSRKTVARLEADTDGAKNLLYLEAWAEATGVERGWLLGLSVTVGSPVSVQLDLFEDQNLVSFPNLPRANFTEREVTERVYASAV